MQFREFKYLPVVALVAVGLGLAACGGGGGSSTPTTADGDGTPTDPTPAEQIAALVMQINALRAELDMDPVNIDELEGSVSDLQGEVTRLQGLVDDAATAARMRQQAIDESRARRRYMALSDGGTPLFDDGATPPVANSAFSVSGTYGATPKLSVTDPDDATQTPLHRVMATDAISFPTGGWSGSRYRGENTSYINWASVVTDVEMPTPTPIEEAHTLTGGSVTNADLTNAMYLSAIKAGPFDGTGTIDAHKFNARLTPASTADDVVRIDGTFRGAPGVYECSSTTAGECASTNIDGKVTLGAGWTFKPGSNAMVQVADANYMFFGYWGRVNSNVPANTGTYAFETFAGGMGQAYTASTGTAGSVQDVTGTADYSGYALGFYAMDDALGGTAESGGFSATANLTAEFGTAAEVGTISGMISGFRTQHGDKDWTVSLNEADLQDYNSTTMTSVDVMGTDTGAPMTAWTIGGRKGANGGMWSANFYGTGRNDGTPEGVSGEFTASFQGAELIGAFGAHNQEADRTP